MGKLDAVLPSSDLILGWDFGDAPKPHNVTGLVTLRDISGNSRDGTASASAASFREGESPPPRYQRHAELDYYLRQIGVNVEASISQDVVGETVLMQPNAEAGWVYRTTPVATNQVTIGLSLPQGLFATTESGDKEDLWVDIAIRIRPREGFAEWQYIEPMGGSPEGNFLVGEVTSDSFVKHRLTRGTDTPFRHTITTEVTQGTYEIGIRKVERQESKYSAAHTLYWEFLQCRAARPAVTDLAIRHICPESVGLRVGTAHQLSGRLDQVNAVAQSRHPILREGRYADATRRVWRYGATRNPAWQTIDVLVGRGGVRRIAIEDIDVDSFSEWARDNDSTGFTCDLVHSGDVPTLDLIQILGTLGRASLDLSDGKYTAVQDKPGKSIVQHLTPRNSRDFRGNIILGSLSHGVRVPYIDPNSLVSPWTPSEVTVYRDGYTIDNATDIRLVDIPGITSRALAQEHGRFYIEQQVARNEIFEVYTDFEHLVARRGDAVRLTHDVPKIGLGSARVLRVIESHVGNTSGVVLDDDFDRVSGATYLLQIRLGNNEEVSRTVSAVTEVDDGVQLVFTQHILGEAQPQTGDLCTVSTVDRASLDCLLSKVEPIEDLGARLTLIALADHIHTRTSFPLEPADVFTAPQAPAAVSVPTAPPDTEILPPTSPSVTEQPDGRRVYSWEHPDPLGIAGILIRYVHESGPDTPWEGLTPLHSGHLTSSPYVTAEPTKGNWIFSFRALGFTGEVSTEVRITAVLGDAYVLTPEEVREVIEANPAFEDLAAEVMRAQAFATDALDAARASLSSALDSSGSAGEAVAAALSAETAAQAAVGSATAAAGSATISSQSADASEASATAATASASAAAVSAATASTEAIAANTSASQSSTSANEADGSATAAASSALAAAASAATATAQALSASTFAQEASSSASDADGSANSAASSQIAAATSAQTAQAEATSAATSAQTSSSSATDSENSAIASAASASAAAASAQTAAGSASAASTSAQSASASSTAAGQSASAANVSATEASTSASNAGTSASNASTSVTQASAARDSAQSSAAAASISQTAAAGFADNAQQAVAGIEATVAAEVTSDLGTRFASIVALRAEAGTGGARLELVALSNPQGSASAARISADQLVIDAGNFMVSAAGELQINRINIGGSLSYQGNILVGPNVSPRIWTRLGPSSAVDFGGTDEYVAVGNTSGYDFIVAAGYTLSSGDGPTVAWTGSIPTSAQVLTRHEVWSSTGSDAFWKVTMGFNSARTQIGFRRSENEWSQVGYVSEIWGVTAP